MIRLTNTQTLSEILQNLSVDYKVILTKSEKNVLRNFRFVNLMTFIENS